MTQKSKWKFIDHPVWAWRDRVQYGTLPYREPSWPLPKGNVLSMGFHFKVKPARGQQGDLDNYIKAVKDAIGNGLLCVNDSQIRWYLEPTGVEIVREGHLEGVALLIEW